MADAAAAGHTPADRLARAKVIFLEASALPAADRDEHLARQCSDDAELAALVRTLLHGAEASIGLDAMAKGSRSAIDAVLGETEGSVIGVYTLLQLIGEGGFGSVYLAEQSRPVRRQVALKLLKAGMDSRQIMARFDQERQALAMMSHPSIAKVFDAGVTGRGRPYFVMELCTGAAITAYCDQQKLSVRARLELFVDVCAAIQHAHHKGIIHRDIKPANLLVETVDGRPHVKVIDFGIAKAMQRGMVEGTVITERHQLVGTPEYMSPEQALGDIDIDTRADVYSLGVVLYQLLTGATPFDSSRLRSAAYAEVQRIIRDTDPPRPSSRVMSIRDSVEISGEGHRPPAALASTLRGELDWIVLKAMEKDRSRRYESAGALARDVQRYLAGEAVQAAPQSVGYRVRTFVRRNRGPVIAAGLVVASLVAGLIGTVIGIIDARAERDRANEKTREAQYEAYVANISLAVASVESRNLAPARQLLEMCQPELRNWEWRYTMAATDDSTLVLDRREEPIVGAVMDESAARAVTLSKSGLLRVTDPRSGAVRSERRLGSTASATMLLSPRGDQVLVIDESAARLFAVESDGDPVTLTGQEGAVTVAAFSESGACIVAATATGVICTWRTGEREPMRRIETGLTGIAVLAVSNDAAFAVHAPEGRGDATLCSMDDARPPRTLTERSGMTIRSLAFTADTRNVLVGCNTGETYYWSLPDLADHGAIFGPRSAIYAITSSPDSSRAALSTWDSEVLLGKFAGESDQNVEALSGHRRPARSITFTSGGRFVVTASEDGTARAWDLPAMRAERFTGHARGVHGVRFNADGTRLLSASEDGTARVWDAATGEQLAMISDQNAHLLWAEFSPDGSRFVTASGVSEAKVWDAVTGSLVLELPAGSASSACASYSPDGTRIVTGGQLGYACIWDARTGEMVRELTPRMDGYYSARFSPDGTRILTTGTENSPCVWDAATGRQLFRLDGHEQWVLDGAFSRDGTRIVTASEDRTLRTWNAADGKPIAVFHGHRARIGAARFSPDATRLFSVAGDNTLRVWDTRNARLLATLSAGNQYMLDLDISPDGTRVATSGALGLTRVWDSLTHHERARTELRR